MGICRGSLERTQLMMSYRNHAKNLELSLGMLKERIVNLEEKIESAEEETEV